MNDKTFTLLACAAGIAFGTLSSVKCEASLVDDARVPILLYHTRTAHDPCEYGSNDLFALEQDLENLHENGFTVMPIYWLVEWMLGWRDGSTLPNKSVGITFDDGYDSDYLERTPNDHPCAPLKSAYGVLQAFKSRYDRELPEGSPHASAFVIASPAVRSLLEENHFQSNWWAPAHYSGLMEVYNHGADHDHTVLQEQVWDEKFGEFLPASGYADGNWEGTLSPNRINNLTSNRIHITRSAEYIKGKIGVWPDLFAHPMGQGSNYTRDVYFPYYFHEHGTVAAFCTEIAGRGASPNNYMQRGQNRWCIPRLTHGYSWRTPDEFLKILEGVE